MTVSSEVSFVSHDGDGVTTTFKVPFYFIEASDLAVNVVNADGTTQLLALDTDYTVAGAGVPSGGSITKLGTTVPLGKSVQIERDPPVTQETDYQSNDPFPAEEHEKALDKLTMIAQRHSRIFSNSLHFPTTESTDGTLPQKSVRALNILGFDEQGMPTMIPIPASVGAGDMKVDVFVKDSDFTPDVTTQLILSRPPGNPDNLLVFFDGVQQGKDQWSVSGVTLTFTSPIPTGFERVYARTGTTLSLYVPPDESVGDPQIAWAGILNRVVSSIAALKALDTTRYTRAFATGFYGSGDGGGGDYWFDSASVEAEVPGIIVTPNAGAGRWKLIVFGAVSLKQFGVKMDDATDDHAAIQSAVDWALAQPAGGNLRAPVGTARTSAQINIPMTANKAFSLVGEGSMSRFRATGSMSMFSVGGASPVFGANFLLRDFSIVQGTTGSITGILLQNANSIRIQGLDISSVDNGILLNASYNVRISGCRLYGCGNNGISTFVTGTNGTYIYDNVISTCGVGINLLVGGNNITIRDNDIEACGVSVGMTNYTSVKIDGNYIENNTAAFFFFGGTNYEIDITQNWFGANSVSTTFQNIIGGSFEGNTVWSCTFTQTTGNLADFIIGHNVKQNGGVVPSTYWTPASFINGFSNNGGGFETASYIKDRQGFVHVRGMVTAGADAAAFVLPAQYRPAAHQSFAGVANNGTLCRVTVFSTTGEVTVFRGSDATADLSGVKFAALN